MRKKIAASVLAVSMLLAGSVQNVLAVDRVSAREAVINAQTAAVVQAAAQLNVPMNPELRQRLAHPALPGLSPALTAVKPAKKKPVSRGSFGTIDVQKVIRVAVSLTGTPYKRSGQTPGGFDCSGFTMYAFKAGAGIDLPHSSAEQAQFGTAVAKSDLAPGDLVFFNTSGSGISHVGIYLGGDNFISASSSKGVMVSNINDAYWGKRYLSARRLAN